MLGKAGHGDDAAVVAVRLAGDVLADGDALEAPHPTAVG